MMHMPLCVVHSGRPTPGRTFLGQCERQSSLLVVFLDGALDVLLAPDIRYGQVHTSVSGWFSAVGPEGGWGQ